MFIVGPVTIGAANPMRTLEPTIVARGFYCARVYVGGGVLAALPYDRSVTDADAPGATN